jgi:hypothetical protein
MIKESKKKLQEALQNGETSTPHKFAEEIIIEI